MKVSNSSESHHLFQLLRGVIGRDLFTVVSNSSESHHLFQLVQRHEDLCHLVMFQSQASPTTSSNSTLDRSMRQIEKVSNSSESHHLFQLDSGPQHAPDREGFKLKRVPPPLPTRLSTAACARSRRFQTQASPTTSSNSTLDRSMRQIEKVSNSSESHHLFQLDSRPQHAPDREGFKLK